MNAVVVRVEGLGKQYRLGERRAAYGSLRETLADGLRAAIPWRRQSAARERGADTRFWALRDLDLDVEQGEILGIIGRNGAGKSTLLKLLSGITEPTEGVIEIMGRVASLLEVGMGFHPELTGRENVFLNGAILGMKRDEIRAVFDDIVAFAEVEEFIDTPVKWYSSGMYLRLAFAVSAHLQPEILIVDEVLAVGDAAFQRRCLAKMSEATRSGKTVLFVSHDMALVRALCTRVLVLERGRAVFQGGVDGAVTHYVHLAGQHMKGTRDLQDWTNRTGTQQARILRAGISWHGQHVDPDHVAMGDTLVIEFDVHRDLDVPAGDLRSSCVISTITGIAVAHISNEDDGFAFAGPEHGRFSITVPDLPLFPGTYTVSLWVGNQHYDDFDYVRDCLTFEVVQSDTPTRAYRMSWHNGLVYLPSQWAWQRDMECEPDDSPNGHLLTPAETRARE